MRSWGFPTKTRGQARSINKRDRGLFLLVFMGNRVLRYLTKVVKRGTLRAHLDCVRAAGGHSPLSFFTNPQVKMSKHYAHLVEATVARLNGFTSHFIE